MAHLSSDSNSRLAFLESLSPEDALRYKCHNGVRVSTDIVSSLISGALPKGLEDENRARISMALSAAVTAFTIELGETARKFADESGQASGRLEPGHIIVAQRRMQAARENAHRSEDSEVLDLEARVEKELLEAREAEQSNSSSSSSSSGIDGVEENVDAGSNTSSASTSSSDNTRAHLTSGMKTSGMVEDS